MIYVCESVRMSNSYNVDEYTPTIDVSTRLLMTLVRY